MVSLNSHKKDLSRIWKGKILWDEPMAKYSTLKVGGPAEAVVTATDVRNLTGLLRWLTENDISWWILGRGSNILVPDHGLPGVAIILEGEFSSIEKLSEFRDGTEKIVLIHAGGGCSLAKAVSYCAANSLAGLEFAVGIPGSIGGAVVMNAGAWGYEIGNLLETVTVTNGSGELSEIKKNALDFSYRGWGMEYDVILLYATLKMTIGIPEEIHKAGSRFQELRKKNQPVKEPSAGSFFKNPPGNFAGRLIDEAGLKGHAVGGAKISEKHANFIVNTGNATAAEIFELMQFVQETVSKRFGVMLEPEVHILGSEVRLP